MNATCLDEEIRATHCDSDIAALFRIAMQCQIIDDVVDYRKDLCAGLPSFLTACAPLSQALTLTAEASRSYASGEYGGAACLGASEVEGRRPERSAGDAVFPLEVGLDVVTAVTKLVVGVAQRRGVRSALAANQPQIDRDG